MKGNPWHPGRRNGHISATHSLIAASTVSLERIRRPFVFRNDADTTDVLSTTPSGCNLVRRRQA